MKKKLVRIDDNENFLETLEKNGTPIHIIDYNDDNFKEQLEKIGNPLKVTCDDK